MVPSLPASERSSTGCYSSYSVPFNPVLQPPPASAHLLNLLISYYLLVLNAFIPFQVAKLNIFLKIVYLVCFCTTCVYGAAWRAECLLPRCLQPTATQTPVRFFSEDCLLQFICFLLTYHICSFSGCRQSSSYFKYISCAREFVLKDICSLKMCLLVLCIF